MKKTIIILTALALIASSCKQAATKQYGGIYGFTEGEGGIVYIYPETDSTALFYLYKTKGAPSYNSGEIDGRIIIRDDKATFRNRYEGDETDCVLRFEFNGNKLTVTEDEEGDCRPFAGNGVYLDGTFLRTSSEIPQYYTNTQGDTIYFKDYPPIENATAPDDTRIIDETCFIIIYPKQEEGYEDETGDLGFYTGNALGKFEEIGIESIGVIAGGKERYLSFALDNGKSHVIDLKDEQPIALLYKKGTKPIQIWIDSESPIGYNLEAISKCLGMKPSEVMKRAEITSGMFRDSRDDKPYGFVLIGTQIWMAENVA